MTVTGPVDFLALTFPAHRVDPEVVDTVAQVVRNRDARILDLVMLVADADGRTATVDVADRLAGYGLTPLLPQEGTLMSDEDVDTVGASLPPGHAAVLLVYEHLWAARVADAVSRAGGEVALHVRIPVDVVAEAVATATRPEPAPAARLGEGEA